jgi:hypothetical protein
MSGIRLEVRGGGERWTRVAVFTIGIYAMEAARALSVDDNRLWRVVDERWPEPTTITYENGVAR